MLGHLAGKRQKFREIYLTQKKFCNPPLHYLFIHGLCNHVVRKDLTLRYKSDDVMQAEKPFGSLQTSEREGKRSGNQTLFTCANSKKPEPFSTIGDVIQLLKLRSANENPTLDLT